MARDDYYMGSLAGLDAYRGDEPAWPDAPQPMGAVANPWADFASRDQPLPAHAPERPLTRGEAVAGAIGGMPGNILKSTFGAASAKLKPNPYPPGSEEAQWYDANAGAQNYEFGPEVAQMMVGGGTFGGVKPMMGRLGTAGGKIVQPGEAARQARATEQGFTRDAYRGEGIPIEGTSFIERHPGRYDPGFLGGDAIYSTNAPRIANDYTIFKAYRERDPAPNIMPLKVKMENPHVISGEDKTRIAKMDRFERDDWLRGVYGKGHDGVLVKYPGGYEEYVAPAAQYRSRFSVFDPAHAKGSDLLKSLAAPIGLGSIAAQDQYQQ